MIKCERLRISGYFDFRSFPISSISKKKKVSNIFILMKMLIRFFIVDIAMGIFFIQSNFI